MQFPCPTCNSTLSLPDDSAGKKAQCPSCQAVFHVPESVAYSDRATAGLPSAIIRPGRDDVVACPSCDKLLAFNANSAGQVAVCPSCQRRLKFPTYAELSETGNVSPFSSPRGFAGQEPTSVNAPTLPSQNELHPYAPPRSNGSLRNANSPDYTTPGWFLFGSSILCLGYDLLWMVLFGFSVLNNRMDADAAIGFGVFFVWSAISVLLHATSLVAGLRMTQRRSLSIARTGSVFGLLPCGICSIIQLPFAIWALVALYNANAPADFAD